MQLWTPFVAPPWSWDLWFEQTWIFISYGSKHFYAPLCRREGTRSRAKMDIIRNSLLNIHVLRTLCLTDMIHWYTLRSRRPLMILRSQSKGSNYSGHKMLSAQYLENLCLTDSNLVHRRPLTSRWSKSNDQLILNRGCVWGYTCL